MIKKFGRFKGYGFISFATQKDADQAVSDWNGKETNGREIKVQPATEPKPIPVKPLKEVSTESDTVATGEAALKKHPKKKNPRKPKKVRSLVFFFFSCLISFCFFATLF